MSHEVSRRSFIQATAAATVGMSVSGASAFQAGGANDRVLLAVVGTNGRGAQLAKLFSKLPGSEVGYICDVEEKALAKGVKAVAGLQAREPKTAVDFRRALEDKNVNAVVIAMPDHWHAPAAILACAAGKDVYRREAVRPQPARGRTARRRGPAPQPHRADGQPAPVLAERHGPGGAAARAAA